MRLKLCFKNTTHKIDNFPSGLEALQETIRKVFGNELPNKWFVIHLDNHKNEKIIKDEESYINILSLNEVDKSSKSIKFIIVDELDGASHGFENLIQSEKLPENTPVFCFRPYGIKFINELNFLNLLESLIREEENFLTEEPNLHQRERLREYSDIQTLDKDQTTMGELEELGSETYDKDQNKGYYFN